MARKKRKDSQFRREEKKGRRRKERGGGEREKEGERKEGKEKEGEGENSVTEHKKIKGRVGSWRGRFPAAEVANVSGGSYITAMDEDFRHFAGLKCLDISWCYRSQTPRLRISKASTS